MEQDDEQDEREEEEDQQDPGARAASDLDPMQE